MAQGYLAQVQKLIDERMKENPEEMKRRLKEIEEAKKTPKFDPQLTQELIRELNKGAYLDIQKVKDLIKRGADIKEKNKWESTVLHQASYFGDVELAKECLQAGIDVNSKGYNGISPLHYAADRDNIAIVELLISAGAKVNTKDEDGWSPLDYAISRDYKKIAALLKQHGAIE